VSLKDQFDPKKPKWNKLAKIFRKIPREKTPLGGQILVKYMEDGVSVILMVSGMGLGKGAQSYSIELLGKDEERAWQKAVKEVDKYLKLTKTKS
jgi:hypothetical protein